jgi:hypothetical protein
MAEEDEERCRGIIKPHASIPATSGAPAPTASGTPAEGLRHAASSHYRAPPPERDRWYVPKEEGEALWVANGSVDHPDVSHLCEAL